MNTAYRHRGEICPRKITTTASGKTYAGYTLTGLTKAGRRYRPFFRSLKQAQAEAMRLRQERKNFGRSGMELPLKHRVEAAVCLQRLEKYGVSLTDVVTLYEAMRQKEALLASSRLMESCLDDFLASKQSRAKEYSPLTLQNVYSRVKRLRQGWGERPIASIGLGDVSRFLDGLGLSFQTRAHYRGLISEFFNFAVRNEWVKASPTAALGRSDRKRIKGREVAILTIAEARELLQEAMADPQASFLVPYFATGLFLGLRPYEAMRLRWEQVDFGQKNVKVLAETSKTRTSRYVEVNETALAWLQPYRRAEGLICGQGSFRRAFDRVRRKCGWKARVPKTKAGLENPGKDWPEDVLRHSYASYWLAAYQNRPKLAELMGNSVGVIQKHYRKPIPAKEAQGYWMLKPVFTPTNKEQVALP